MKINEVAKLTGVTVRTLHYYDEIGLLKPSEVLQSGYRQYSPQNLETLQQILFFKELDFSLSEIKEIMKSPNYDKQDALHNQKNLLTQKRDRLNFLIKLLDKTIEGGEMSFKEFDSSDITASKEQYAKEVRERWGTTDAYAEYQNKSKKYTGDDWQKINDEYLSIIKKFADHSTLSPQDEKVQAIVKEWQDCITKNFYNCTPEILSGLADIYTSDERFSKSMDAQGEGTAEFMAEAIKVYCNEK